ncbi:DMT family transporter [Cohnella hashimotonis]|uniref:DMT family transporter n=1 Tax=Cohnella hashimotonis TaxID=2826895 RepID=A0ABT6TJT3_9BACL|nr:DMT family transporter [Cohnella hashimotonis]MDI4647085.1 DMT family transporter [Cohnella hashimotonis]
MFVWQLVLTSLLWAGNFVAGKWTAGHASAMMLSELRFGIAILVILPFVWMKEKRLLPPRKAILLLLGMGATGVTLFNVLLFEALAHTSAANTGLLSTLNPAAIALISFLAFGHRLTLRQAAGMLVSFAGVVIVLTRGDLERLLALQFNRGDLMMIGAVLFWGCYTILSQKAMAYVSPLAATLWSGIFGLAFMLPFNIRQFTLVDVTPAFWAAMIYIGVGATVIASLLWNLGVKRIGGTHAGIFLNLNPVFTSLLAYLLLDERMNASQWIGTAVVIGGMLLFSTKKRMKIRRGADCCSAD